MAKNTNSEQNKFFLERKIRRVWQSLGRQEGEHEFVVGINMLSIFKIKGNNVK